MLVKACGFYLTNDVVTKRKSMAKYNTETLHLPIT